jgi:hypothetical protein
MNARDILQLGPKNVRSSRDVNTSPIILDKHGEVPTLLQLPATRGRWVQWQADVWVELDALQKRNRDCDTDGLQTVVYITRQHLTMISLVL